MRRAVVAVLVFSCLCALPGCGGWRGLNSLPLPGTAGKGKGAYTIQAQLPDVVVIQPNTRVRVADVNIGNVTKIEVQDWHALVTMRIDGDIHLPANSTAKVGQTSLLGSMHIELAPPKDEPPQGQLKNGSVIPLSRAATYPTTEQTLASVAILLNGGGLGHIQELTKTFATALTGREKEMRSLLTQLDIFVTETKKQTDDIITAIDSVNSLVGQVADKDPVVDKALTTIPQALGVLSDTRKTLVDAIDKVGQFSAVAASTIQQSKKSLVDNFRNLAPALRELANAGPALTRGLDFLTTLPWVKSTVPNWFRGDFANISLVVDLTLSRLDSGFFTGSKWEGNLTELEMQWGRTIGQMPSPYTAVNPLIAAYHWGVTRMAASSKLRLSRGVWTQLTILAVVTLLSIGVMAFGFVKVPAMLGVGRYTVKVDLPASGGLYPTSVVNYRGSEIGSVKSVDVTRNGVQAVLSLKSDIAIPRDVTAAVHSRSAVGEQFLELTPHSGTVQDTGPKLRDGDVIAVGKTQIPVDIGSLLDTTNKALAAIPQDNLHTVVEEASKAVAGLGPELSRLVDGGTALAIDAGKTSDSFSRLIDEFPPVASSQVRTSDSIATWARRVNAITSQVKAQDERLADLLNTAGPALDEGTALFDRLAPTLPVLLANLVSLGTITVNYRNDLEQLLVMFPQGTAVMSSIIVPDRVAKMDYKGIYLDFNLNLNSPPPCNAGFLPVQQQRIPVREDYPDRTDGELYCRIPQNSDMNVRGVRNVPCETKPGKRAPTVEMCESDEQYVPLNDGLFWKGDPNATLSGQSVPQFPKGGPPYSPGEHWHPPVDPAAPKPVLAIPYDPLTGNYVGPDGRHYSDSDLAFYFERQDMAEHGGAAAQAKSVDAESVGVPKQIDVESTAEDIDAEDFDAEDIGAEDADDSDGDAGHVSKKTVRKWVSRISRPIAVGVAIIVALLGVGGWLGFRLHQDDQVRAQRNLYVQVARQTAINLTTINYTEVDADIKRVLDSSTGDFHDEFQSRSQPFVEVVKKVQSKTEGTIAEAGLLSYRGDQAQVLVAISVKTSMAGAPPDQEPRRWRMRLTVDKNGDSAKVSKVEFVP